MGIIIRDARPSDAPFLAKCILAGFHFADFDDLLSDDLSDFLDQMTECEGMEDTLYTYSRTRIAEVDGQLAGSLLSYPGELYIELRAHTFKEFWPASFTKFANDDPETEPGEYYIDSLAVHPAYRKQGIGRALLEDGIKIGISQSFNKIALVADSEYDHLIRLYESIGFVPAEHRHAFGTDFMRMIYSV